MYSKKVHTSSTPRVSKRTKSTSKRSTVPKRTKKPRKNSSKNFNIRSTVPRSYYLAKNVILTVIALAMLTMILFTIYNLIATPEFLIKREIENITTDYYENYFYSQILENNSIDPNETNPAIIEPAMKSVMPRYAEPGFARLTLRQLLLYDNKKHYSSINYLSEYCDLDQTLIKIYPEEPFGRKNYRVDYSYYCKF